MALDLKKYLEYNVHHCQLFQIILEVTTVRGEEISYAFLLFIIWQPEAFKCENPWS